MLSEIWLYTSWILFDYCKCSFVWYICSFFLKWYSKQYLELFTFFFIHGTHVTKRNSRQLINMQSLVSGSFQHFHFHSNCHKLTFFWRSAGRRPCRLGDRQEGSLVMGTLLTPRFAPIDGAQLGRKISNLPTIHWESLLLTPKTYRPRPSGSSLEYTSSRYVFLQQKSVPDFLSRSRFAFYESPNPGIGGNTAPILSLCNFDPKRIGCTNTTESQPIQPQPSEVNFNNLQRHPPYFPTHIQLLLIWFHKECLPL